MQALIIGKAEVTNRDTMKNKMKNIGRIIKVSFFVAVLVSFVWLIWPDIIICHIKKGKKEVSSVSISFMLDNWVEFYDSNVSKFEVLYKTPNVKGYLYGGFGTMCIDHVWDFNGDTVILYGVEGKFKQIKKSNLMKFKDKYEGKIQIVDDIYSVVQDDSCDCPNVRNAILLDCNLDRGAYDKYPIGADLTITYDFVPSTENLTRVK